MRHNILLATTGSRPKATREVFVVANHLLSASRAKTMSQRPQQDVSSQVPKRQAAVHSPRCSAACTFVSAVSPDHCRLERERARKARRWSPYYAGLSSQIQGSAMRTIRQASSSPRKISNRSQHKADQNEARGQQCKQQIGNVSVGTPCLDKGI